MKKNRIYATDQGRISLGNQGENLVRQIVFPVENGEESWMLLHQRSTDETAYPVPLTKERNDLIWDVTAGDTAVDGSGRAVLICTGEDGEVLKSQIYQTYTSKSIEAGGDPPEAIKPWYDSIMEQIGTCSPTVTVDNHTLHLTYGKEGIK